MTSKLLNLFGFLSGTRTGRMSSDKPNPSNIGKSDQDVGLTMTGRKMSDKPTYQFPTFDPQFLHHARLRMAAYLTSGSTQIIYQAHRDQVGDPFYEEPMDWPDCLQDYGSPVG